MVMRSARYPGRASYWRWCPSWSWPSSSGTRHSTARPYHAAGAGLLVDGGLANGLERLVSGAVTDFILVGRVVVNLADVAVVIGIAILTIDYARENLRRAPISAS